MTQLARAMERRLFVAGAAAFGASALLRPVSAWADDETTEDSETTETVDESELEDALEVYDEEEYDAALTEAEEKLAQAQEVADDISAMQDELAIAAESYYKALDEYDTAIKAVEDAEERLTAADTRIDELQERLSSRMRNMYRNGEVTVFDLLMGSSSFKEFAQNWDLLESINEADAKAIEEAKTLRSQVESDKATLEQQEQVAEQKAQEAETIKADAEKKVASLQVTLDSLDDEIEALTEQIQDQERAAEVISAAAYARQSYSYYVPTTEIPSQGTVVDYALSRIGCPYEWGAEGPDSFDCSGLVRWAYLQVGMSVPHQTLSLYYAASARLPVEDAEPGDVLWIGYGGTSGHVGIAQVAGGTTYIHAPTFGAYVRNTDDLSWAGFTHALRFEA